MSLADLVFLAAVLTSIVCLIAAVATVVMGSPRRALRILGGWLIGVALYAAATIIVKVRMPARDLSIGEVECSDEWCLAVEQVERTPGPGVVCYLVTLRLSSHARGTRSATGKGCGPLARRTGQASPARLPQAALSQLPSGRRRRKGFGSELDSPCLARAW